MSEQVAALPKISNYGNYSSDNYGVNSLCVRLGTIALYYSYQTIVAYSDNQDGLVVCENVWGVTTGKHLNWIDRDHSKRIGRDLFKLMLQNALERHIT